MKKILTLFIAICMLISAIPMVVSAETINPEPTTPPTSTIPEAPTAPAGTYTVDVSSTGTYKTLIEAYNAAVAEKGATSTEPIAIRILDNISMVAHLDFSDYAGTVYIYGKENSGSYPTISGPDSTTVFMTLGADTVIYNINFVANGSGKSFVIQAAFHKLTIGEGFTGGEKCQVTGAVWSYANADYKDNVHQDTNLMPSKGAIVNIYSGSFYAVFATWRDDLTYDNATDINHESIVNIFGGSITSLRDVCSKTKTNYPNTQTRVKAKVTVNILGGSVKFYANAVTDDTKYTVLNYTLNADFTTGGGLAGLKSRSIINTSYIGVQNTGKYPVTPEEGEAYEAYSIRFVGVVDSLKYDTVGFKISCGDKNFDTECNRAYKSIVGGENDYTTAQLGGEYIFAAAIKDIPTSAGELTFTVMPYVVVGETTYYGAAYTVTYNAGAYVSSAVAN